MQHSFLTQRTTVHVCLQVGRQLTVVHATSRSASLLLCCRRVEPEMRARRSGSPSTREGACQKSQTTSPRIHTPVQCTPPAIRTQTPALQARTAWLYCMWITGRMQQPMQLAQVFAFSHLSSSSVCSFDIEHRPLIWQIWFKCKMCSFFRDSCDLDYVSIGLLRTTTLVWCSIADHYPHLHTHITLPHSNTQHSVVRQYI